MELRRWTVLGYVSIVILFTGIFLLSLSLFWSSFLMLLSVSFLVLGVIGLTLVRRKVSIIKRRNPEVIEVPEAQSKKRREDEKTVGIRDLPPWIMVLLLVVVVAGYMGALGTFRFNPLVDTLLSVLMVLSLIFYFIYKRRVRNKKYN
jgi:hypothetical protein